MRPSTLKQEILDESYKMISEFGSDKFSVRILSKKLNVSHNALYKHYKSKQELLFAIADIGYFKLGDIYLGISERSDLNYFERLKECTYAYVEYIVENPNIYALMVNPHMVELKKTNSLVKSVERTYGTLIKLAENSIKENLCTCKSAHSMVNTAWAVGHGLSSLIINKQFDMNTDLNTVPLILNTISVPLTKLRIRDMIGFTIESVFSGMQSA